MRKNILLSVIFAGSFAVPVGAQDLSQGEEMYKSVCRNCHGPKARGMASFPRLTGKGEEHIVQRLEQYRAGETVGPNSALMFPLAEDLSDEDIVNLATYISDVLG